MLEKEWTSHEYVDRLLEYGASKSPVLVVVDNIDQLEEEGIQADVFSNVIAFAQRSSTHLSIVLRDATYVRHKSDPVFDAFDFNTIYIDPPPVPMVLARRFELLEQLLKGKSASFIAENGAKVKVDDLSALIGLIRSSVLGTKIGTVINALAGSDIRLALRMTREFLESGYSNPGRAIMFLQQGKKYTMPKHEALRSVLLGKQAVYQEETSLVGNPFDTHLDQTNIQLLRLFIIHGMVRMASQADFRYLPGADIHQYMLKIGVGEDACLKVLSDLSNLRFVRTAGHGAATFSASFYPTRLSGYVVRYLIANFTFLESMMMDTFIADPEVWGRLKGVSEEIDEVRDIVQRVKLRTKRAKIFFKYMENCYNLLREEAVHRMLPTEWCSDPFSEAQIRFERNLRNATKSAQRLYGNS